MMTTIQDVARQAHVGVATVSRVLNGSGYVKEDTKERVLRAIEALNYTPNEMARSLYHRKSGIIAIIVPEISHPFFAEFINEVEISLFGYGYQSMICNTWKEENYEAHYLEILKQQRVDGIITGVHTLKTQEYESTNRPIVALDRNIAPQIPCVSVNHREGGRMAAEELIRAGCKNVVQCTGGKMVSSPSNVRHEVFAETMKEHGAACHDYLLRWNTFEYSYYRQVAEEITDKYPEADGFFATDVIALSLIQAAMSKGRRYPEDFKVVAYDGTYVSNLVYPSVTTIVQPIHQLAVTCVQLIMELIQGKAPAQNNVQLDVALRPGESTKSF